jgi:hypothetical protein
MTPNLKWLALADDGELGAIGTESDWQDPGAGRIDRT